MDDYGKAGLAAAAFSAAVLCYMASCGVTRAAEVEIRWQHPGGDPRPYDAVSLCDSTRCVALELEQLCASGAGPGHGAGSSMTATVTRTRTASNP